MEKTCREAYDIYTQYKIDMNERELDFRSIQIGLPSMNPLPSLCGIVLDNLMLTPIDTLGGLSVVCEQPMGNPVKLNIKRPGVLRQYYGKNIGVPSNNMITRVTYGYRSKRNGVNTDPNKFVTKPFDKYLHYIAIYLKEYLSLNKKIQYYELRYFP